MKKHCPRPSGYDVSLIMKQKLEDMVKAVDRMFPKNGTIGIRFKEMQQSLFINDFLFNVLGEQPKNDTKMILREYFRLDE